MAKKKTEPVAFTVPSPESPNNRWIPEGWNQKNGFIRKPRGRTDLFPVLYPQFMLHGLEDNREYVVFQQQLQDTDLYMQTIHQPSDGRYEMMQYIKQCMEMPLPSYYAISSVGWIHTDSANIR